MARLPRLVIAGAPHLVIHRSNSEQPVFLTPGDAQAYRGFLLGAARELAVRVLAYGFVDNEVRLLLVPPDADGMSRVMQSVARSYAAVFNRAHQRSGSPWEGRFRSAPVDTPRVVDSMRLVEGAETVPARLMLSSYMHHAEGRADALISPAPAYWALGNTPFDREVAYRRIWPAEADRAALLAVRNAALKGWAVGDSAFAHRLARSEGRPAAPRAKGRPPRVKSVPN